MECTTCCLVVFLVECRAVLENIMCGMCRPAGREVLLHPFFWNSDQRLTFLLKASDRVEHEDRVPDSAVLPALEGIGPDVFGASWETKLDSKLLDDGRRYRKYNFSSVRDLLRIIRNKSHHFLELPHDLQVRSLVYHS